MIEPAQHHRRGPARRGRQHLRREQGRQRGPERPAQSRQRAGHDHRPVARAQQRQPDQPVCQRRPLQQPATAEPSRGCLARSTCSSFGRSPGVSGRWDHRGRPEQRRRTAAGLAGSAIREAATWAMCRAWAAGGLHPAAVAGFSGQRQHPQLLHPAGRQPADMQTLAPQADVLRRQLNPSCLAASTGSTPPPAPTPPATARPQRPAAGVGKSRPWPNWQTGGALTPEQQRIAQQQARGASVAQGWAAEQRPCRRGAQPRQRPAGQARPGPQLRRRGGLQRLRPAGHCGAIAQGINNNNFNQRLSAANLRVVSPSTRPACSARWTTGSTPPARSAWCRASLPARPTTPAPC